MSYVCTTKTEIDFYDIISPFFIFISESGRNSNVQRRAQIFLGQSGDKINFPEIYLGDSP